MNIEHIKKLINEYIKDQPFTLYDVKETTVFDHHALEILIDNEAAPISTEDITLVHQYVLTLPDDVIPDTMMIEVSSVGIERPLLSTEDYMKSINKYVFITSDYFKGYGTIKDVKEDVLILKIQEKTKQKTIEIPLQAISQARRAVKI